MCVRRQVRHDAESAADADHVMAGSLLVRDQRFTADNPSRRLVHGVTLAAAVGVVYYLTAEVTVLGLVFQPEDVAVFWPAAGVSSGVLIGLGPRARWPVAAGVMVAEFVAATRNGNPLWVASGRALCDAAEPLIIAGLITRYFGADFALDRLRNVLGLLAATLAGCAVSSSWAAVVSRLEIGSSAAILSIGLHWFASVVLGVLTVAPLIIGLFAALREPPPPNELAEGAAALVAIGVMTGAIIVWLPKQPWETVLPGALLLPALLWLAARCRPVFAAGGAFMVSLMITGMANFGIGHFGDTGLHIDARVLQAQVVILEVVITAYVLAALFHERRESEARLAHSNALLQRERDNKLLNLEAAISVVAHEVKQPLTGIEIKSATAELVIARAPLDVGRVERIIGDIKAAGFRANAVLDSVSALFRKDQQEQQPIDVNETVSEVLQSFRSELQDHNVTAVTELASGLPLIKGHKGQLQEVLVNLVRNAIEAMDATRDRTRSLRVSTELRGRDTIKVAVQDTGPGINAKQLDDIFGAFVTTKARGMGLGLPICRMIIERHGGRLTASSDGKTGALFQFVLPIKPTDAGAPGAEHPADAQVK
jgi:signal transduction histidine kinase